MSFNFMKSLKTARTRVQKHMEGEPVQRYAKLWVQLQATVVKIKAGKRTPSHKLLAEVKQYLKTMLSLLVEEMKEVQERTTSRSPRADGSDGAAPPVFEHMMKNRVISMLCAYAKEPLVDLIFLHHLTDIVLFSPLLRHYKAATQPIIDVLQFTEQRVKPWELKKGVQDMHARCLSHGFIQLVYSIAFQLCSAQSAPECVDFFFVGSEFRFNEKEEQLKGRGVVFLLLDFTLPYLKRREEVVAAQEIDFVNDFAEHDRTYQIYTSEVALDALICLLRLQNTHVCEYLTSRASMMAELACLSLATLCRVFTSDDEDEWVTKETMLEQLVRRLRLLEAVALNQSAALLSAFHKSYDTRVLQGVFKELLLGAAKQGENTSFSNPCKWHGKQGVMELICYFLQNLDIFPFCDQLCDLLLGVDGETEILEGLLDCVASEDCEMVPAALNVVLLLFRRRPHLAADVLLGPTLAALEVNDSDLPHINSLVTNIDGLFNKALFTYVLNKDTKTTEDQHINHIMLQAAVTREKGNAQLCALQWHAPEGAAARSPENSLLASISAKFATIFDQSMEETLVC